MITQPQNIAKNTTWLTASYILQKILAFIYFTLIARFMGASNVGIYSFSLSLTTIFSIFIDFGLSNVLIREAAKFKEKANNYLNNIISVKIIFSLLSYLAVVVIVNLLNKPALTQNMVYLAGLIMIIDSFTLSFFAIFRSQQNLKFEAVSIVFNQIIILIIGLTGIFLKFPLYILIIALLGGSLFNFLYSLIFLKIKLGFKLKFAWDTVTLKTLFKIAIPFALAGIFTRVYSYIDQVLLSILIGDKHLGWYSVPYKITYAFQFLPAAFSAAIYPAMSQCYAYNQERLKMIFDRSMYLLIIMCVPLAVGIAILADKIIISLYTNEYQPSILALQIMIVSVIPLFLSFPIGSLLNACDKQATNTINIGVTMVFSVILNLILIPKYQHIGAAITALLSLCLLLILNIYWVPKIVNFDKRFLLLKFGKTLLASAPMGMLIIYLKPTIHFGILMVIAALIYLIIMYLIGGFTKDDITFLWQAIFKKTKYEENTVNNN